MSDHDPQCYRHQEALSDVDFNGNPFPCDCDLIARTRADERERIAQEIEAQPIDAWGSPEPRGPVSFARAEAFVRAARIARGGAQ